MTPTPDDPLQSPQDSDSETNLDVAKGRPSKHGKSPLASLTSLPYRRSNASLSTLFQSTTSLPIATGSPGVSGTVTPTAGPPNGSVLSPGGAGPARPASPAMPGGNISGETKDLILRAFAPHVSVLASPDTEELIRHKGVHGGLLELLRPFGEHVQGKVTIRDSVGASRSWDDYAVRFTGVKDGLESPHMVDRRSMESVGEQTQNNSKRLSSLEFKPARLRSGGDVAQVEELVERHLTFAEEQSGPVEADYLNHKNESPMPDHQSDSPFYMLYLRRLLSGMPMVPSETMSHPVATVIAISSRSPNPIEELRTLYASSNTGEHRLPPWVLNEFLRYYILVHDEDYDDISKSMALYDQMKRHFGLHCHLLRLRSAQCVPSDDDSVKLPHPEWMSAAEELAEIIRRETSEDDEDPTPFIFESDASAIRSFVREMVTQSLIPSMERASAQWNDQVASRRRGISGRFMSLSKRFTTFGVRSSSGPSLVGGAGSNYDSAQGHYKPDAPEAVMRRLADHSMMLRDFKLAQGTYEILCQDFKNDKAWRYYAGANEMAAVSTLLAAGGLSTKARTETVDQYLETAYYSYITRVNAPYNALRTLMFGTELLKLRGGSALDDSARWLGKITDDHLVGPTGYALMLERSAQCYSERPSVVGLQTGERKRKAAFWHTLAADAWSKQDKNNQAESCLVEATRLYTAGGANIEFGNMHNFIATLQTTVKANRAGPQHLDLTDDTQTLVEPMQQEGNQFGLHSPMGHRKSISTNAAHLPVVNTSFDPLGAVPSAYEGGPAEAMNSQEAGAGNTSPIIDRGQTRDDGFE
jgi:hypothetical protein